MELRLDPSKDLCMKYLLICQGTLEYRTCIRSVIIQNY